MAGNTFLLNFTLVGTKHLGTIQTSKTNNTFILLTFSSLSFGCDYDWRTVPVPSVQNDRILREKNLTDSSRCSESLFSAFPILNGK